MAQSSDLPTLRDFFNSKKAGEEDEFLFYHRVLNSSSGKTIPPRPHKAKEKHGFFFNQVPKERRSRRNISEAEKFSVEQYSSGGFFGVRLNTNTNTRQQQQQQQQPRLQKSFSARMQFSFMPSSKGSNNPSWFSRIKKMSNPFSNRNPTIPKSGEIKISDRETLSRKNNNKYSSPVHLNAYLTIQYELGMPVFTFSLVDRPEDVYIANTWMDDNDSRFVYSFRYIGGKQSSSSSLIGQMQVSTQICLEPPEPYEDPVESSTVSEFVLFDIARARRSEKLSRQNSFRQGLDLSQEQNSFSRGLTRSLSKHSENTTASSSSSSDPWPVSDLHSGLEIAAIVVKDSSCSSLGYMKDSKIATREMKVIVPTGNHGLPDTENSCPTPILQRWRSGGGCDCSGWDMGCHLFVLESADTGLEEFSNIHHGLELFIEGGKEKTPTMTMVFIREGHYEINFHAKLSALQAFSVCVAELHKTEVSRGGERSNSWSRCSSLRELIDMETPVNRRDSREEVLSSFMPNVTFSPISRV